MSTPPADGERFALVWRDQIPLRPFVSASSFGELGRVFEALVRTAEFVSEGDIRRQLAGMGLPSDDIEDQIERARRMHTTKEQTTWERTTRIGYRNNQGQDVVRKTRLAGNLPDQRVYVLHCGECGHEYGANGCDVHRRRCPHCQDGPPGLPTSHIESTDVAH